MSEEIQYVSAGTRLRAGFTGKVYRVRSVKDGYVYVQGLPKIPEDELMKDIDNGKIEILS